MTTPTLPKLAMAIVAAQASAEMTEKDGTNNFHRYDYVSAEQLIHKCSAWLNGAGLALVPLMSSLMPFEAPAGGGEGDRDTKAQEAKGRPTFILQRHYLLVHDSGECLELSQDWPVVPEKGRPTDKAVAVADTSSLAYMLRNLVLVPRVDEGEDFNEAPPAARRDDRRDDRREEPKREPEKRQDPPREERRESRPPPKDDRREDPPRREAARDESSRSPRDELWDLLLSRVEKLPDVVSITDESLFLAARTLFRIDWDDVTDDIAEDELPKLRSVSNERLTQLIATFFTPF